MVKLLLQFMILISLSVSGFSLEPMSLTVSPILIAHKIALTQALAQIGLRVQNGYVLFGIDIRGVPEPEVELKISDPITLGAALAQIVGQLKGYGYRAVSDHVVEVYPIREFSDPADVMNLRIADMVVTNTPAMDIFSKPDRFIPELRTYLLNGKTVQACGSIGPGFSSAGAGISLDLHSLTVRDALDAVAEADATLPAHADAHSFPVGWTHIVATDEKGAVENTWSFLASVPHNWEHSLPKRP